MSTRMRRWISPRPRLASGFGHLSLFLSFPTDNAAHGHAKQHAVPEARSLTKVRELGPRRPQGDTPRSPT